MSVRGREKWKCPMCIYLQWQRLIHLSIRQMCIQVGDKHFTGINHQDNSLTNIYFILIYYNISTISLSSNLKCVVNILRGNVIWNQHVDNNHIWENLQHIKRLFKLWSKYKNPNKYPVSFTYHTSSHLWWYLLIFLLKKMPELKIKYIFKYYNSLCYFVCW